MGQPKIGGLVEMDARVLFVSPHSGDVETVARMLGPVSIRCETVASLEDARARLAREPYGAVLTAAYLPDGDWKDVLDAARGLGPAPAVIVTHCDADDVFWAEVLNLGCYDMLAQPFDAREVQRILTLACSHALTSAA